MATSDDFFAGFDKQSLRVPRLLGPDESGALVAEVERLREQNARLAKALEPFVAYFTEFRAAEAGQDFSNWVRNGVTESGFVAKTDFAMTIDEMLAKGQRALAEAGGAKPEQETR